MKKYLSKYNIAFLVALTIIGACVAYYFLVLNTKDEPGEYFIKAQELEQTRQYSSALAKYKEAINENPGYTDGYIQPAELLLLKNRPEDALEILEAGIGFANDQGRLYQMIANTYALEGNFESAITNVEKALDYKNNTEVKRDKITYLHLNKSDDAAREYYGEVSGSDAYSEFIQALLNYDNLETGLEKAQKAAEKSEDPQYEELYKIYEEAIKTEDNKIEDYMNIAQLAIENDEMGIALGILRDIKKENKFYEGSYIYEGYIYMQYNSYDTAIGQFEEANQKVQNNYQTYKYLAYAYLQKGDVQKASDFITSALNQTSFDDETRKLASEIFFKNNETDKALAQIEVLLDKDPSNFQYVELYSQILLAKKDYAKLVEYADSELESNHLTKDDEAVMKSYKAWALYNQDSKADAKDLLTTAENEYIGNPYVHYYLGLISLGQEQTADAIVYFENAINFDTTGKISELAQEQLDSITN